MSFIIGIDASRNRSGGAIAHLVGILSEGDPLAYDIQEIHIWSYKKMLDLLPDKPWLVKHHPPQLERSLIKQVWWQFRALSKAAKAVKCNILFTTDASTVCRFSPMVVLSQDMLSYEPGIMKYFGFTKARLRLIAILLIQNRAMRFADGVIFLTQYAAKVIQRSCGRLSRIAYIPHGVGNEFKCERASPTWTATHERSIQCLYVSNAAMYKHQWVVVQAITALRKRGHHVRLTLIGGGSGRAQQILNEQIAISDPDRAFVKQMEFIPQRELPSLLASADLFIFASSCENMPVTLVEAMAVGLPIACSNRGPMPEVLANGGIYFDPEDADSIAQAIEQLITDPALRVRVAQRAKSLAEQYTWSRCADETWTFIVETYKSSRA